MRVKFPAFTVASNILRLLRMGSRRSFDFRLGNPPIDNSGLVHFDLRDTRTQLQVAQLNIPAHHHFNALGYHRPSRGLKKIIESMAKEASAKNLEVWMQYRAIPEKYPEIEYYTSQSKSKPGEPTSFDDRSERE